MGAYHKQYYIKNRVRLLEYHREWRKKHPGKSYYKPYRELSTSQRARRIASQALWRVKHPDKIREYMKTYCSKPAVREKRIAYARLRSTTPEGRLKRHEYHKKYYAANRQKIIKRASMYKSLTTNQQLAKLLRWRVNNAIRGKMKPGSSVKLLGCSIEEFRVHLESLFLPGMSWMNRGRGGWHIDHIKPLCLFNLEDLEEFRAACHYTNLQPLWERDNLSKNKKFTP